MYSVKFETSYVPAIDCWKTVFEYKGLRHTHFGETPIESLQGAITCILLGDEDES